MKDRIFEARDIARALGAASQTLGVPVAQLRYVVLDEGRPESDKVEAAPARIAVLLDATARGGSQAPPPAPPVASPSPEPADVKRRLARLVAAVAEAAGEALEIAFEESEELLILRLSGPGEGLLLANGGEALRALEHIMQRAVAADEPRRLLLSSRRFREERDTHLRDLAQQLAAAVRADGAPRETEPLNSYDRRIVHLAVQDEAGVTSFSVGEGSARRVTLAADAGSTKGGPAGQ